MKEYNLGIGWFIMMFALGVFVGAILVVTLVGESPTCDGDLVCVPPPIPIEELDECIDVYTIRGNVLISAQLCEGDLYE